MISNDTPKENEFIDIIKNDFCINAKYDNLYGIGDDCAVFSIENKQVVTCDMLVENTHFDLSYISTYDLGRKSALVNISDIAAMGAKPKYAFVSIGYNNQNKDFLYDLYKGLSDTFKNFGVNILGGDTVKSEILILNITMIGETDNPIMRSGAKVGDSIIVTNYLGLSHAGLDAFFKYGKDAYEKYNQVCKAHICPKVSCELGIKLNPYVNSMIDLSDGLSKDIETLCKASDVGAFINLNHFKKSKFLEDFCNIENKNIYDYLLTSFEEYCLLLTCNKENNEKVLDIIEEMGFYPSLIGEIIEDKQILVSLNNKSYCMPNTWEHF